MKAARHLCLDIHREVNPIRVGWVGFDDEKILVVTGDLDRDRNLTIYDFSV
jgi:hypothetical protein